MRADTRGAPPAAVQATGAAALAVWVAARAKDYEVVAQRRDADGPMVDRALEIVRLFIVERGLVLFGGLAVDYALRLKGAHIYPDDQRPDFDCFSTRSVDDAYDLADRLQQAGFEGVGAVRGIHVQTMKVRTDFVWVADIGYAPPDVLAAIPTFEYHGMRVAHPDYQRMDMHLAFCFPFNGPPREDVFHRWRKDLARFNLFETHYPIAAGAAGAAGAAARARLATPVVGHGPDLKAALHGFAAYAAIRAALDSLAAALGRAPPAVAAPRLALAFPDDYTVEVELPAGDAVTVASPWPEEVAASLSGLERFCPYMDVYPESFRGRAPGGARVDVLSTKKRLLAATLIRARPSGGQAFVVTPQYLLLWLLFQAHLARGSPRATYRGYYAHTLEVIRAAETLYADAAAAGGAAALAAARASFATSPFAPALLTIGDLNHDAAYTIKTAANAQRLQDVPPAVLGFEPGLAAILKGLPANYYPATSKRRPVVSYTDSPLFCRSGHRMGS